MSEEYDRFQALLRKVVTTPREVVVRREQEEEAVKEWRKRNDLPAKRERIRKAENQ